MAADDPDTIELPLLELYDNLSLTIALVQLSLLLVAGIVWTLWPEQRTGSPRPTPSRWPKAARSGLRSGP